MKRISNKLKKKKKKKSFRNLKDFNIFLIRNNYFANFLYLFMNLSTLPAVSTNFTLPV